MILATKPPEPGFRELREEGARFTQECHNYSASCIALLRLIIESLSYEGMPEQMNETAQSLAYEGVPEQMNETAQAS